MANGRGDEWLQSVEARWLEATEDERWAAELAAEEEEAERLMTDNSDAEGETDLF